jgi:prepilin-type N-terminal cleavage/methylation domain-containing protein
MISAAKKRPIKAEKGFSLLEMVIAVTLVALMAVAMWAVFRISIRSWSRGSEFIDANQRHRSIMDLVRKQMASTYGLFAQEDPLQSMASTLVFSGTSSSLHFVSLNSLRFMESPGLTLVAYEVVQDSGGDFSLVETEARYLGQNSNWEAAASQSGPISIFNNLSSCTFEYLDPGNEENPAQWVREWNGEELRRLPGAISVSMVSHDPKGAPLSRQMVVPLQAEANDLRMNFINPFGNRRAVMQ